jgi:hypothetical protein
MCRIAGMRRLYRGGYLFGKAGTGGLTGKPGRVVFFCAGTQALWLYNADILNHCREPGVHVRGCWAVDMLTGRP